MLRMKKLLLLISTFCFVAECSAQWQPVNSYESYHFTLENSTLPVYTIKVDSSSSLNSDSIFFLNRVACENCTTIVGGPINCDTCYGKYNQPQFLQKEMIVSPNGTVTFSDTADWIIQTYASLNETWQFSTLPSVTAQVISLSFANVLGNTDSIKTIALSSGDTLILSKNNGLLQFPFSLGSGQHYYLSGIETQQLGFSPPTMKDFFNFDVGDMFEYWGETSNSGIFDVSYYKNKYEVTQKTQNADTLIYHIQGYGKTTWFHGNPITSGGVYYGIINRDIVFIDSVRHFGNNYCNQFFSLDSVIKTYAGTEDIVYSSGGFGAEFYDITKTEYDTLGLFTKYFGQTQTGDSYGLTIIDTIPEVIFRQYNGPISNMVIKEGLGQTSFSFGFFEYGTYENLVAYRKGNDTVGVFTSDSLLIEPPPTCADFAVVPTVAVSGNTLFCNGDSIVLTAEDGFDAYLWSTGDTTQSITVDTSGVFSVSVQVNDSCWFLSNTVQTYQAVLNPVIQIGDELYVSHFYSYQWYLNGEPIIDAIEQTYCPLISGAYSVVVHNSIDCSATSQIIELIIKFWPPCINGISENSINDLTIYPNPATNTLTLNTDLKNTKLTILNAQGQLVQQLSIINYPLSIDISQLNSGIYFLSLTNGTKVVSKKFVKE